MRVFGPVPSRRLGRSIGINNIPPKICSYSCIYCQLGRSLKMSVSREVFFPPQEIVSEVKERIGKVSEAGESIDYLTFVPDGEPTLDLNLEKEISLLKPFGIKIAVITNSSLIWQSDVRSALMNTDWISFKIDTITESIWERINRPYKSLKLNKILDGILEFSKEYHGKLTTETMLIKGVNDEESILKETANFISSIKPYISYISIPTRPPAEKWVQPPEEETIGLAFNIFKDEIENVECLIGYEGNTFAFTGNIEEDILSITSVHPMRKDAVEKLLDKANSDWSIIEKLISQDKLVEVIYQDKRFYIRKFSR